MTTTTMRRGGLALLATSALAAVAIPTGASATGASAAATTRTVKIVDVAYKPRKLTIGKGTKIRWLWQDQIIAHTVTPTGRLRFTGASERRTGSHTVTFRKRGTYRYFCLVHPQDPNMKGTITVR